MEPENKTSGALIGSMIIVIILIVGGVYLWKVSLEKRADQDTGGLDSETSIESDLENTDLETLDSEI